MRPNDAIMAFVAILIRGNRSHNAHHTIRRMMTPTATSRARVNSPHWPRLDQRLFPMAQTNIMAITLRTVTYANLIMFVKPRSTFWILFCMAKIYKTDCRLSIIPMPVSV